MEVNADMSRHVKVAVSRLGGTFGRVRVSYTISYDVVSFSKSLSSSTARQTSWMLDYNNHQS